MGLQLKSSREKLMKRLTIYVSFKLTGVVLVQIGTVAVYTYTRLYIRSYVCMYACYMCTYTRMYTQSGCM